MIAKIIVLCALVYVSASQVVRKPCVAQNECGENECCAKKAFVDEAYCIPQRQENEICLNDALGDTLFNGVYDITCPCRAGLSCTAFEYIDGYGVTRTSGFPRCMSNFRIRSNGGGAQSYGGAQPYGRAQSYGGAKSYGGAYSGAQANAVK